VGLNLFNVFLVVDLKTLVKHAASQDSINLPDLYQGESPPTAFTLLQANPAGGYQSPWSKVSPALYSLRMGLFLTSSGAQLAFQDTWTDDAAAGLKYGNFDYDSAAITTALGGNASIACTWESEVTTAASKIVKVQKPVTLYKQLISPTTATVAAGEVAATQAWARATMIPKDGSSAQNQCDGFIILSRPSGIPILVYWDDAGIPHSDPQG